MPLQPCPAQGPLPCPTRIPWKVRPLILWRIRGVSRLVLPSRSVSFRAVAYSRSPSWKHPATRFSCRAGGRARQKGGAGVRPGPTPSCAPPLSPRHTWVPGHQWSGSRWQHHGWGQAPLKHQPPPPPPLWGDEARAPPSLPRPTPQAWPCRPPHLTSDLGSKEHTSSGQPGGLLQPPRPFPLCSSCPEPSPLWSLPSAPQHTHTPTPPPSQLYTPSCSRQCTRDTPQGFQSSRQAPPSPRTVRCGGAGPQHPSK